MATRLIGGDCYDSDGCAKCAGYVWCEMQDMCIRIWETECEDYLE